MSHIDRTHVKLDISPIHIKVDIDLNDPEILHRIEKYLIAIAAEILPGPAVTLDLVPGPITEQKE